MSAAAAGPAPTLRVLHLDHTSVTGGAEFALARMLRAQPAWRPLLLLPPDQRGGVFAPLAGRIPIRTAGVAQPAGVSAAGALGVAAAAAGLVAQAVATRLHPAFRTADVIDANTARAAAYGALAAVTSRTPFVVHLRDTVDAHSLGRVGSEMMSRVVLPRADGVIANSRATLATAAPFLRDSAHTAVIPSAAGLRRAVRADRAPGPLRIGMLARIDPWKGQDLLLDAFADVFGETDATLELAGGAPFGHEGFAADLRRRARDLGVDGRVFLPGHVDDVAGTLARWDVAVQYSRRPEPLGQNVLQYLASGCVTVVADEGGPTEWVTDGENGLRVPPRDAGALAAALRRLADDPLLRGRLAAAAAQTPGILSDAEVGAAHARFYADVHAAAGRA